jgi:hypothetical protein
MDAQTTPTARIGQYLDPAAEDFLGIEADHYALITDASRMLRERDLSGFSLAHLAALIEEARDLQAVLDYERRAAPDDCPF